MKKILIYGMLAFLGVSLSACHKHHDPSYDDVTPPEVAVAPNTLSGIVTDMQGNPIAGATVRLGSESATTGENGVYEFGNVTEGTYTLSASAKDMFEATGSLTVDKSATTRHYVWNATLARVNKTSFNVTVADGGQGQVESDALKGNDEGKVDISVNVPDNVVPEDTEISITPIYTEASASVRSAAEEETLLIGATLACSDPSLSLSQDIELTFALDSSIASSVTTKKYVNGRWVEAPHSVTDGNVVISTRDFTSYGIFLKVNVSTTLSTEKLVFAQSQWDNLYGRNDMNVEEASFSYKIGTQITSKATNKLEGLLIEHLARLFGTTVTEAQGSYPINVTLPVGTALTVEGAQERSDVTVSANSKSVTGTSYGTVNVRVTTYNRNHNGGGSSLPGQG